MKDIKIQLPTINLLTLFKRHHLTISIIFVAALLATVVLLVNSLLFNPAEPSLPSNTIGAPSSSQQLEILRNLHTSDEFTRQETPEAGQGRISPFLGER